MKKESKIAAFFGINKYARVGAVSTVAILAVLIVALTLNALMGLLPYNISNPDITGTHTFRVSGTTIDWLQTLDEDVTLHLICEGGKSAADGDIYSFLQCYDEASDRVTVNVIDPSSDPDFISAYGGEWPENMSVIAESKARYKLINSTEMFYYYSALLESNLTPAEYTDMYNYLAETEGAEAYLVQFAESVTAYFDGESRVTNAINFVTRDDVPIAYMLTGSGASELDSSLKTLLSDTCYEMRTTLKLAELPDDCDVLIIQAPTTDLTAEEAAALSEYLADGGKLVLTTFYQYTKLSNLAGVLAEYGLGFEEKTHMAMEGHTNYAMSDSSSTYPYFFKAHVDTNHAAMQGFEDTVLCYYPHAITLTETEGVTHTSLLYTSAAGYLTTYDEESKKWVQSDEKEVLTVGALAEKGDTRIFWVASADALTSQINAYSSNNGNFNFVLSVMNHMSGVGSDSIAIESAMLDTSLLAVTGMQFLIFGILLVVVIPVAVLTVGIIVWYVRKKR